MEKLNEYKACKDKEQRKVISFWKDDLPVHSIECTSSWESPKHVSVRVCSMTHPTMLMHNSATRACLILSPCQNAGNAEGNNRNVRGICSASRCTCARHPPELSWSLRVFLCFPGCHWKGTSRYGGYFCKFS
jgi:hypothetical protein